MFRRSGYRFADKNMRHSTRREIPATFAYHDAGEFKDSAT
jgi:hypothetical protein